MIIELSGGKVTGIRAGKVAKANEMVASLGNAILGYSYKGFPVAVGYVYDSLKDVFTTPQKYASWSLNAITLQWEPPTPAPNDGHLYEWDELTLGWRLA